MPHALDHADAQQQQKDDAEIARLLNNDNSGKTDDALDFLNRDLEVGEKADDAEDFEDIGDDDLASEVDEDEAHGSEAAGRIAGDARSEGDNHQQPADGEFGDDLFGDEDNAFVFGDATQDTDKAVKVEDPAPSKPAILLPGSLHRDGLEGKGLNTESSMSYTGPAFARDVDDESVASAHEDDDEHEATDDDEMDEALVLQRALFAQAGRHGSHEPPDAPENDLELFFSMWPTYDPEETARFSHLFPSAQDTFNWKTPLKPPKPLPTNKLNLEIATDTERMFNMSAVALAGIKANRPTDFGGANVVSAVPPPERDDSSGDEVDFDDVDQTEVVGGLHWRDIELACCDWDVASLSSLDNGKRKRSPQTDSGVDMDYDTQEHESKRTKNGTAIEPADFVAALPLFPPLDDPERSTARLAKRVVLDEFDTELLIDETLRPGQAKRRTFTSGRGSARDPISRDITRRYNISNDGEYELLKENHQHKIRSTLGSVAIEHSLPAVKLQYPFYRVKLDPKQSRSFHRQPLSGVRVGKENRFHKPKIAKRKHLKGRETRDIFGKSEDLSMGDNSSGLLLEYSEEKPNILSGFGMGNRVVNFYRRKDENDSSRPKEEIGETQVLLPQDRSPFANFGHVDPGELVPAIQNGLYRAPIFKHTSSSTDFLVVASTTGENGTKYFLRDTENLHVVGQQFPSVEVPGEHSRKVTDAAKRRLKAISYRVWRKWSQRRGEPLTNAVVLKHLPGSDIAQNRGKMREFMKYDKNQSIWVPKDGDIVPETAELRSMIKPEDICLLDAMQVGVQHLNDLGLRRDDEANDDDDDKEGENIEILLAPWSTTKNFINACQGKAMLKLHGEGDPTGRGEGYSFIKTSMKGGFRALGESIEERLDAKRLKENHGHSYNVARQQRAYDESIRRIWRAQHDSLTSKAEHSDTEADLDDDPESAMDRAGTPRTSFGTPAAYSRREDESVSQFSKSSSRNNQTLIITRFQRNAYGHMEEIPVTITNPRVISAYKKAKLKEKAARIDPNNVELTGDKDFDELQIRAAQEEIARLERNVDRRYARQRAKGIFEPPSAVESPTGNDDDGATPSQSHIDTPKSGKRGGRKKANAEGTGRRCANCGQIGHIKTNKKLCPMLNGTMRPEDAHTGFGGAGGGAGPSGTNGASSTTAADTAPTPSAAIDSFGGDDDDHDDGGGAAMNLPGMEI